MQFRQIQWFIVLTIVVFLVVTIVTSALISDTIIQTYIVEFAFVLLGIWFLKRHGKAVLDYIRLHHPPWWSYLVVVPAVIAAIFIASFVTAVSMMITRSFKLMDIPDVNLLGMTNSNFLLVLTFSVLPGIVEEFYCRGVLLQAYRETVSTKQAIFWSALAFGLIHLDLWNALSPMVIGIIFGLFTVRFDSILPAMFGHALFNLLILGVQKVQPEVDTTLEAASLTWSEIGAMAPITLLALAVLWIIFRRLRMADYLNPTPRPLSWREHIPTLVIFAIFAGISYLVQKGLGL